MVITYAMGPIALICLRRTLPEKERPFKLPAANFLCLLAFYCCNLFSYWTGWETISKLAIMLAIGILLFGLAYLRGRIQVSKQDMKAAGWIIPYLLGIVIISALGSFGGKQVIPFGCDFVVIGLFSVWIFYLAVYTRSVLSTKQANEYLFSQTMIQDHA